MTIRRYSEDNADSFNDALQDLEDLYNSTGNAMELVASGTASAAGEINMDLGTVTWAWLTFRAALTASAAGDIVLWANRVSAGSSIYYTDTLFGTSATVTGGSSSGYAICGYGDVSANMMDVTIFPHSIGFSLLGTSTVVTTLNGLFVYRFGSTFTGLTSAPTSLQIRSAATATFSGAWRLEGVRS